MGWNSCGRIEKWLLIQLNLSGQNVGKNSNLPLTSEQVTQNLLRKRKTLLMAPVQAAVLTPSQKITMESYMKTIQRLLIQRLQLTDTKLMTRPTQFLLNHLGMARNTETTNSIDLYYIQLPNYFTK